MVIIPPIQEEYCRATVLPQLSISFGHTIKWLKCQTEFISMPDHTFNQRSDITKYKLNLTYFTKFHPMYHYLMKLYLESNWSHRCEDAKFNISFKQNFMKINP